MTKLLAVSLLCISFFAAFPEDAKAFTLSVSTTGCSKYTSCLLFTIANIPSDTSQLYLDQERNGTNNPSDSITLTSPWPSSYELDFSTLPNNTRYRFQLYAVRRNSTSTSNWTGTITKGNPVCDSQSTDDLKADCGVLADLYNSLGGENWTTKTNWNTSASLDAWHGIEVSNDRVSKIDLARNNLRGSLSDVTLSTLSGLTTLYLNDNSLSGRIPSPLSLYFPSSLTHLRLNDNNMNGTIPHLKHLSNVIELDLSDNAFTLDIPTDINNLTSLEQFNLYRNSLGGTIPDLSALTSLVELDLGMNSLSGDIPDLDSLDSLRVLRLDGNSLGGTIESVGLDSMDNLQWVHLQNNRISGTVPQLSSQSLEEIRLDDNRLSGTLDNLAASTSAIYMRVLHLSRNNISGTIPDLSSLSGLSTLVLDGNSISGTMAELAESRVDIFQLDLGNNKLSGVLPDLSFLVPGKRGTDLLSLHGNNLSGSLPDLSSFTGIRVIDLADNSFSGKIGDLGGSSGDLSVFSRMYILDVSGNSLSGQIPASSKLPQKLEYLQLNDNDLSGSVPSLSGLAKLKALGLWGNPDLTLTGITLPSGMNRSVIDWAALWTLHYKNNGYGWNSRSNWTGEKPLGQWHGVTTDSNGQVTVLNLRSNNLRGGISGSIAALEKLTTLNLSCNSSLSGELPLGLKDITMLTTVNICSTGMTVPSNSDFTTWKNGITFTDGTCSPACPQPVSQQSSPPPVEEEVEGQGEGNGDTEAEYEEEAEDEQQPVVSGDMDMEGGGCALVSGEEPPGAGLGLLLAALVLLPAALLKRVGDAA